MNTGYYFYISKSSPNYEQFITECEKKHAIEAPGCLLSIADFNDGDVLVKVKNGNSDWLAKFVFKDDMKSVFDYTKKEERIALYNMKKQG